MPCGSSKGRPASGQRPRYGGGELVVTLGHDLRTTTIRIRPPDNALWKRRCNWCNAYAYYAHGIFLGNVSNTKVELI